MDAPPSLGGSSDSASGHPAGCHSRNCDSRQLEHRAARTRRGAIAPERDLMQRSARVGWPGLAVRSRPATLAGKVWAAHQIILGIVAREAAGASHHVEVWGAATSRRELQRRTGWASRLRCGIVLGTVFAADRLPRLARTRVHAVPGPGAIWRNTMATRAGGPPSGARPSAGAAQRRPVSSNSDSSR